MKTFLFERPAEFGFSRSPKTIVRVDIMFVSGLYFWSYHGSEMAYKIDYTSNSPEFMLATYALLKEYGWTLLGEVNE